MLTITYEPPNKQCIWHTKNLPDHTPRLPSYLFKIATLDEGYLEYLLECEKFSNEIDSHTSDTLYDTGLLAHENFGHTILYQKIQTLIEKSATGHVKL